MTKFIAMKIDKQETNSHSFFLRTSYEMALDLTMIKVTVNRDSVSILSETTQHHCGEILYHVDFHVHNKLKKTSLYVISITN